jgi:plastocyanin
MMSRTPWSADSGLFRSSALDTGQAHAFRFDRPGTYRVLCSMHPQVVTILIVE